MGNHGAAIVGVFMAIIGVAVIAVLVSNNSNTSNVISGAGSSFSNVLSTALSPVASGGINLGSL